MEGSQDMKFRSRLAAVGSLGVLALVALCAVSSMNKVAPTTGSIIDGATQDRQKREAIELLAGVQHADQKTTRLLQAGATLAPIATPPTGAVIAATFSTDHASRKSFRNQFLANTDFVIDVVNDVAGSGVQAGGQTFSINSELFPALYGEGVAYTLLHFEPCGINLPHIHPRAAELTFVIQGEQFLTTFVEESGVRAVTNYITEGQSTIFPKGLVHFEQNLGCTPGILLAAFGSDDPGVSRLGTEDFALLPTAVTAAGLGLDEATWKSIIANFPASPAAGDAACLARCGITAAPTTPGY